MARGRVPLSELRERLFITIDRDPQHNWKGMVFSAFDGGAITWTETQQLIKDCQQYQQNT